MIKCKIIGKCNVLFQRSRKRRLEKLMVAETVDGGLLREAAMKKSDASVLLEIADKDCVALEVKYHKRCYEQYTVHMSGMGKMLKVLMHQVTKCSV